VGLVEVLWTDVQGSQFREGRWRTQATILDVFDTIVGYQMLCYATDVQGKGFFHESVRFEFVTVRQTTHQSPLSMLIVPKMIIVVSLGTTERMALRRL
jgi:hypothetical protein